MRDNERSYGGSGRGKTYQTDKNFSGGGEKRGRYAGKHWNNGADAQTGGAAGREQRSGDARRPEKGGYNGRPSDKRGFDNRRPDQRGQGGDKRGYGDRGYDNFDKRGGDSRPSDKRGFDNRRPDQRGQGGDKRGYGDRGYDNFDKRGYDKRGYEKRDNDGRSFDKHGYDSRPFKSRDDTKRAVYDREPAGPAPEREPNAALQAGGADELPFLLIGRNAVREAVKSGRSIDRILVNSEQDGSLREIVNLARDSKLVIREVDRKKLDELCMPFGHGGKTANHQGIVAYAAGMEYCSVSDILKAAKERGEEPFVIVLDGVEDPHNLGSIIRSAECAGAHGVIIGKRRSASVTAAAVKAAAGATAYMRVARVVNVSGALEELKRAGLWVAGADMDGTPMDKQGLNGALALVIGGEGGGLTKLVKETCDFLVSIPMQGRINSLNASVAAAVLMFEKRRQDAVQA